MNCKIRPQVFVLACLLFCAGTFPAYAFQSYFSYSAVKSDDTSEFPRWTDMLSRYDAESHKLDDICGKNQYSPCKLKEWKDFMAGLRGRPLMEQMIAVDQFINKYPYVEDIVNWGFDNYWETPYEFQRKSGNCKDYAIAKFVSLRALGVEGDVLRVTVVQDLNLGGIIHAVLLVFDGDNEYVLDNQIQQVVPALKIYHYVPIYAINEDHWWKYLIQR